ncbi:peroxisomal carnitine O-octanoyltransferase [Eublepharis macularius]|uniref:Peroxisomal carnitine O-octanoyltransferase n=1 Tax=Eublepharis macularius TaxID=481883 RepID=A0AA97JX66_EUBMA|nr:peroxisomal carnitine O-octanoyltransferase [Eublepharis macularius]XP_054847193.1 peroxisomal carnitine O-octanoyltransferase [Eublepharis macularius]XP_054847194.1 peroxisomal carnitine O-octanoyltransferase [Eublepharis macularius]XP_054847195.1 peroxisomal carnitine O-octanoyltransferase [Eublepharis macularius]
MNMENQVTDSSEERTFQYQRSLPSLPVPALDESLKKYLDSVKPFLNQEEYQRTESIVKAFENGIGKELQQKLLERAKVKRNWLEEWWLNVAYLEARISTQIFHNFGGPGPYLEHYWVPKEGSQIERGSLSAWHTLKFWELIRTEKLPVHRSGNVPLDMDQFRMLFCTCKIPGITQDSVVNYFRTETEGDCPSHLIVLCRGRIFAFDAVHDGQILSPPEIFRQLTYIQKRCSNEPKGPGLAALTSEERTQWAQTRDYLINLNPKNLSLLEKMQTSLFTICLDEASPQATPEDYTQVTKLALAGDPTIRWGDKSYNLIVFSNGTVASLCDHSPFDAMVVVVLCSYIDHKVIESEGRWKGSDNVRDIPWPEELVFSLNQKILNDITHAKEKYYKQTSDMQLVNYAFTSFGKSLIKKQKLHPDTFVQLALQLAYYKLHGHPASCYETAMTRRFYHGRTETMRPCTVEAVEWCKSMLDPHCTPGQRLQRLLKAVSKHNKLMKECENGKGFDRHLLGLLLVAKDQCLSVPDLFLDPAFPRSGGGGNFVLSTSLVGYTRVGGAVVPMVHHGYGFFYRIRDDRIVVACSTWISCSDTDAEKLCKNLFESFQDIIQLTATAQL